MKKINILFLTALGTMYSALSFATTYTWNGTTSTAWGTATNWTPNGTVGSGDNVVIVSASNNPIYDGVAGVTNITMTSGTLDLDGHTLNISGNATFHAGTISNGKIYASGSTTVTFEGTTFNCVVETHTTSFNLDGSTFNEKATFEFTSGGGTGLGDGGNVFNDTAIIINSNASNYVALSVWDPDTFNSAVYFENNNTNDFYFGYGSEGNVCAGDVYIRNAYASSMFMGLYGTITFDADVYMKGTTNSTIFFAYPASGSSCTMTTGTLKEDGTGFNAGNVYFTNFHKTGTAPVNLDLGTTGFSIGENSVINGNFTYTGSFFLNGCTFNDSISFTHNNSSGNYSGGGNVFNAYSYFANTNSTGNFYMAHDDGDDFNANATFETTSTGRIYPASSDTTYFSGDLNLIGAALSEPAKFDGLIIWDHNTDHYLKREYGGVERALYFQSDALNRPTTFKDLYLPAEHQFNGKMW